MLAAAVKRVWGGASRHTRIIYFSRGLTPEREDDENAREENRRGFPLVSSIFYKNVLSSLRLRLLNSYSNTRIVIQIKTRVFGGFKPIYMEALNTPG